MGNNENHVFWGGSANFMKYASCGLLASMMLLSYPANANAGEIRPPRLR